MRAWFAENRPRAIEVELALIPVSAVNGDVRKQHVHSKTFLACDVRGTMFNRDALDDAGVANDTVAVQFFVRDIHLIDGVLTDNMLLFCAHLKVVGELFEMLFSRVYQSNFVVREDMRLRAFRFRSQYQRKILGWFCW